MAKLEVKYIFDTIDPEDDELRKCVTDVLSLKWAAESFSEQLRRLYKDSILCERKKVLEEVRDLFLGEYEGLLD